MIKGAVDAVSTESAIGWIYSESAISPLTVQAIINHQVVGEGVADLFRPDLERAGLGQGYCGFEIRYQSPIDPLYLPFVDVRPAGATVQLPRANTAGFAEYFSALYRRYPGVGRQASVLGGFWTDRSDAAAVLKGRVDIGLVPLPDSGPLSRFIQEGLAVLELETSPAAAAAEAPATATKPGKPLPRARALSASGGQASAYGDDLTPAISEVFFDTGVLRLLRMVFDDHALAIRADIVSATEAGYCQISGLEDLPSPAESLGILAPLNRQSISIEVLRGSQRFPEFLSSGVSRWTYEAAARVAEATSSPNVPADLYKINPGTVAVVGPGLLHRIELPEGALALRILALPARQGLLRFRQKAPRGEIGHPSGARIWISGDVSN
jgi:hypothetical protein